MTLRTPLARRRRGIATMMVLAAMLFLAATIVGMTTLFAHEARRTRAALAEMELRQLLMAGEHAAQGSLVSGGTAERDVPFAVPVDGAAMSLHVSGDAAQATVRVAGTYRGFTASQILTFARGADGKWELRDARLDQTGQQ